MKTPSALLLLADGTEEMEAVITSDILSRAGFSVTRAAVAVPERIVQCANGMTVQADVKLEDVKDAGQGFDVLVLPGGAKGSKTFSHDAQVQNLIKAFAADSSKWLAAICAAPLALRAASVHPGARVTCYPGCEERVCESGHFVFDTDGAAVVVSGRLITSRGPGTAYAFALRIVEEVVGAEAAARVKHDCLIA